MTNFFVCHDHLIAIGSDCQRQIALSSRHPALDRINRRWGSETLRYADAIPPRLLLVVPFLNRQVGLLLWLCAWIMFIVGKLFDRKNWKLGGPGDDEDGD